MAITELRSGGGCSWARNKSSSQPLAKAPGQAGEQLTTLLKKALELEHLTCSEGTSPTAGGRGSPHSSRLSPTEAKQPARSL